MKPTPNAAKFIEFFDDVHRVYPRPIPSTLVPAPSLVDVLQFETEKPDLDIELQPTQRRSDGTTAEYTLESLLGWRADKVKGGKGGKKKRTTKPKCVKGRSCGMSCIAMSKRCPPDKLGPAADVVAKSVASSGGGESTGGQGQSPRPAPQAAKPKAAPQATPQAPKPVAPQVPPKRTPTPLSDLALPQGVKVSESFRGGVSVRAYEFEVNGNPVRVTFDIGPSGVISSNFLVNDSFDQGGTSPSDSRQIQSVITQVVKADISSRADGARYTGEAWTGDGQGGFREAMYAKMGFSLGDGKTSSPGDGQYGLVQDGNLVPSTWDGTPLAGDDLAEYKGNLRNALRQGIKEAREARANPEMYSDFFEVNYGLS